MNKKTIINYIVEWLKEYNKKAGTNGFVIGISGGIDSAVTSVLAAKTNLPILCLEMPIYQDNKQQERANNHIKKIKKNWKDVNSIEIELTPVFEAFIKQIPTSNNTKSELSLINTRARIRMMTLYYFAQLNNYLVLGTGNKVEDFGIGFFTKYGDGGVDLSPIADLSKSEVYLIGKELNISNEILTAPPTDGLWNDSRTDEEQIGATYAELEWAMNYDKKKKKTKRESEVLKIYKNLRKTNMHKMKKIPVCKISENKRKY
tara:strand:- start:4630 stop:5409 length:780 start_codon:yes stop_codon:yes gene_type:complete